MKKVRIACKLCGIITFLMLIMSSNVFASLTKDQSKDVASFATTFIEKGNARRDEKGYPLLVYALSNNWKTCIEIRRSGYKEELYHIKNNNYHMKNGKYLDLGPKWCMDCGDFISYIYKITLGLDMYLEETEDPWHIKDMYADANKYKNSEIFEFVYKNVPIASIDESKLELGDVVIRMGSRENHGLIYVGEEMQTAHASRNAIKYSNNSPILGFEVVQLNRFYKSSTIVSIIRVKDGVVDKNKKVNSTITWPDTGETEDLLSVEKINKRYMACKIVNGEITNFPRNDALEKSLVKIVRTDRMITSFNFEMLCKIYAAEVTDLNNNPEYIKKHILDWLVNEIKRFLMTKAGKGDVNLLELEK